MGLAHQSLVSPCHSFFLFFFLSLSLFLFQDDSLENRGSLSSLICPGFEDSLGKVPSVFRGGDALRLHPTERAPVASVNRASPVSRTLLAFCVNQGRSSLFFSPLYLSSFADAIPPEGIPGSFQGWSLVGYDESILPGL